MKARIIVAVVGLPALILILGIAPELATVLLMMALCGVGAYEMMHAVASENGKRGLTFVVVIVALAIPAFLYMTQRYSETHLEWVLPFVAMLFLLLLFLFAITGYGKTSANTSQRKPRTIPFGDVTTALFAGILFPLMLSCLLRLRLMENGQAWVFVPLCIAFGSDTFALLAGMLFGKHKLTPVSPKKTVEGAFGGLAGGVIGMLLFKWIALPTTGVAIGYFTALLVGVFGSAVSQIGDLSFSVIKREYGVKDYGKLLPGHGGVLDRFDSVTFVAPVVWLILSAMQ